MKHYILHTRTKIKKELRTSIHFLLFLQKSGVYKVSHILEHKSRISSAKMK